jgi:type IV pilus assembly protein PilC
MAAAKSTYAYRVRDAAGQVSTGTLVASSSDEVGARLRSEGKIVLSVEEHGLQAASLDPVQIRRAEAARRVRKDDVIGFCQQLSVMLETGVPLTEALDSFCSQSGSPAFRQVLEVMRDDIHAGDPISVAMSRWPRIFPTMIVSLMKASEASGTMAVMLGRVGEYLSKERRTLRQIRGALAYPMFMVVIGLVLTVFLMTFVLPRFSALYASRGASLPTPTRVLMGISEFLIHQWMFHLPAFALIIAGTMFWLRTASGRYAVDWARLHVPILRSLYSQVYLTRSARTMATLFMSGVNLLDIISICRGVTNNKLYDRLWSHVEQSIRDGRQISEALHGDPLIPPSVSSMIAAGERSGRLADVMGRIAQYTEEELDATVKQVTTIIEPLMICFMGLLVGGIALALLLPIFSMGKVVTGQ